MAVITQYPNVTTSIHPRTNLKILLTPTPTQLVTLVVAGSYILAIAIIWYVSFNNFLHPGCRFFFDSGKECAVLKSHP